MTSLSSHSDNEDPPSRARATSPAAAALLLVVFYAVLLLGVRPKSATFDEPGHATAGYTYWKWNDFRIDPENGNLPQRWVALPLIWSGYTFPPQTSPGWDASDAFLLSDEFFNQSGNDTGSMLARGRAMAGLFAVALGWAVWRWSRDLFGPLAGMISLILFVTNPGILANGALMNSDTVTAFFFLLGTWTIWRTLHRVTFLRVAGSCIAVSFLFLSKMSAPLIIPIALILVAARIARAAPLSIGKSAHVRRRLAQMGVFTGIALIHAIFAIIIVWGFYGFRYSAFSDDVALAPHFAQPWEWALRRPNPASLLTSLNLSASQRNEARLILQAAHVSEPVWTQPVFKVMQEVRSRVLTGAQDREYDRLINRPAPTFLLRIIEVARNNRMLPEAFLFGYARVLNTSSGLTAFYRGKISSEGWISFFPFIFLVKSPMPLLALAIAGLCAVWMRPHMHCLQGAASPDTSVKYELIPLIALWVVYWSVALASNLNIGHRHLLPIYPALFIIAGGCVRWLRPRENPDAGSAWRRPAAIAATAGLTAYAVVESALTFPNFLAYFNGLVAPSHAYRYVVDSSLDWGQELPAVKRYLEQHGKREPSYLAYFGVGSPAYYGIDAYLIGGHPGFENKRAAPLHVLVGVSNEGVDEYLRMHRHYDPGLRLPVITPKGVATSLVERSEYMRLTGGMYLISASLLPSIHHGSASGDWSPKHDEVYQRLRREVQPLLSDDTATRATALGTRPPHDWATLLEQYYDFRFARLAAFLRNREPDANINYSVLVYRLTDEDVKAALEKPIP